jgi:hypothetical protein
LIGISAKAMSAPLIIFGLFRIMDSHNRNSWLHVCGVAPNVATIQHNMRLGLGKCKEEFARE